MVITIVFTLILAGLALAGYSLLADITIGHPGFGPLQIMGTTAGALLVALGGSLSFPQLRANLGRWTKSPFGLVCLGIVLGLVLSESVLQFLEGEAGEDALYSLEKKALLNLAPDPVLVNRLPSGAGGHDANGYRNDRVPDRAHIVALGDSWTWGVNAKRDRAWPQQLDRMTGRSVYNMAMGGFGPAQYLALTDEVLMLSPEIVVIGLYTGNDIINAETVVYGKDFYADLRDPTYRTTVGATKVRQVVGQTRERERDWKARYMARSAKTTLSGWTSLLLRYTATVRLLYRLDLWPGRTLKDLHFEAAKAWANEAPEHSRVVDKGNQKTILHTAARLLAVNLGDARVREGLSLTERILGRIRKRLTAHDAWLLVVLLPSKELSFAKAEAADGTPLGPIYTKAANMETEILRRLRSDLKARGIASVDLLPAFQTAIAERRPVFPTDGDTHPTPEGYRLIASRVAEEIAALGW